VADTVRYAIGDLADLAGVSRRTVRYYVQEGLLPAPFGLGRGNHYGPEHLDQLLRVKSFQEAGRSLDEIKRALGQVAPGPLQAMRAARENEAVDAVERTIWRRLSIAPGVEIHVAGDVRLPPPGKLNELARWCRLHFHPSTKNEDFDA
jgi:DNA-binding transcriptional MerR regulator